MKNFSLLINVPLFLFAFTLSAQESPTLKPQPGEFGFQLTALGIGPLFEDNWSQVFSNNELHIKYAATEKRYYTLGFFVSSFSDGSEERDSVLISSRRGIRTITSKASQTGFVLIPGIEHHFPGTRRLDPFISLRLPIGYFGKFKIKDEFFENSIQSNGDIFQNTVTNEYEEAGGFTFGLSGALGLNYYVTNKIAIGVDYSISLEFSKFGGDIEETETIRFVNGTNITTSSDVEKSFDKDNDFEFSNQGVLGLNFVFFFGKSAETE